MPNQTSKYLPIAVVIIVIALVAGIQYYKNRGSSDEKAAEQIQNGQSGTVENQGETESVPKAGTLEDQFTGTLKISDNLKRGNLMLITEERTIYLFTSRDYSALLDKAVRVEVEGTLENFRLVDIAAK